MAWGGPIPLTEGQTQEIVPDASHHTQTDSGPGKTRARPDEPNRILRKTQLHTTAQYNSLKTYYLTTLKKGSLTFDETDPIEGGTSTFRFAPGIGLQAQAVGPSTFSVSFDLEVLP